MKVLKFGGTSVANSKSLTAVVTILKHQKEACVVVVSALGGVTDLLISMLNKAANGPTDFKTDIEHLKKRHFEPIEKLASKNEVSLKAFVNETLFQLERILNAISELGEITKKSEDTIASYGEILSSRIIASILQEQGIDTQLQDSRLLIRTDKNQNVDFDFTDNAIQTAWKKCNSQVLLAPGFIATNHKGKATTLGRGGSDYTAAIFAKALDAESLEIWTDVSGMFTANPKLVPQAMPIGQLTYYEAMELSHFGAKVIYPPTLQPLVEKKTPIWIKNTFEPEAKGTLIDQNGAHHNGQIVKGISHIDNIALINLEGSGMVGIPGFSKRLFEIFSDHKINIVMITQASSEHSICLGISNTDADRAKELIDEQFAFEIALKKVAPAHIERELVNIAVVGDRMKDHQGISGKLFSTLGANNINIRAIAQGASERNISFVIDKKNVEKALNTLHESFFEAQTKQLNLFVVGAGNVGGKLLEQIEKQQNYLKENLRLTIQVRAISNSRKMVLSTAPIDLKSWKETLDGATTKADRDAFFDHIKTLNLRNSIFVDNTASPLIAKEYLRCLQNSICVVTCNKIACADQLDHYLNLKRISRKYGSPFLFETNVGAGLPIIDTLNNLIASGDQVTKIQAVLSGSLNFIFNNFKKGVAFDQVVAQAMQEGYTEPDPKIDLSGIDVARKILILARESGYKLELEEIKNNAFIPQECLDTPDTTAFLEALRAHSDHFNQLLEEADRSGARIKYVAQLENGKAQVGLQQIDKDHDFYNLEGSDNIVLFYTNRYAAQPLIVKGAGAGAEVTASGLFADIIRIGKQ